MLKSIFVAFIILCSFTLNSTIALATINETQAISFGSFALQNNDAQHDYRIHPDGTTTIDAEYLEITSAQEASYDVSGFPNNTPLIVTVVSSTLTLNGSGSGEAFTVVNFDTLPASPQTDGSGNETFALGTTLRSSGSTTMYPDGNYSANATVSVNF